MVCAYVNKSLVPWAHNRLDLSQFTLCVLWACTGRYPFGGLSVLGLLPCTLRVPYILYTVQLLVYQYLGFVLLEGMCAPWRLRVSRVESFPFIKYSAALSWGRERAEQSRVKWPEREHWTTFPSWKDPFNVRPNPGHLGNCWQGQREHEQWLGVVFSTVTFL